MKKLSIVFFIAAALIALVWSLQNRTAEGASEEADPETEVSVHSAPIIRTTLRDYITAYGNVGAEPSGERPAGSARVATAVAGVVSAVHVNEGQQIVKGSLMFELDSRTADISVAFARKTLERQRQLLEVGGTSTKMLQQAEQQLDDALAQQSLLRIASPLSGTVTRVNVRPGEAVDLTTVVAEVVNLQRLVVNAAVPDAQWAALRLNQPAEVLTSDRTDTIVGQLSHIGTEVDVSNGSVPLRIAVPADSGLRPGQFVTIRIVTAEHADTLAVPLESVSRNAEGETVISVISNKVAEQRSVTTGFRDGGLIEISAAGLQPGMQVVTEGAYALPGETRVHILED